MALRQHIDRAMDAGGTTRLDVDGGRLRATGRRSHCESSPKPIAPWPPFFCPRST